MEISGEATKVANNANISSVILTEDKIYLTPKEKGRANFIQLICLIHLTHQVMAY